MPSTSAQPQQEKGQKLKGQLPYNVILLNDDEHSFVYVVRMLKMLFGYTPELGYRMALEVHTTGRAIVATMDLEQAELKRDQIHAFGPDPLVRRCKGSMSALIEPAHG
jgi:ATP-dependent Clp protease adaptor protein ClpS